jgi:pyridinium-3,5-bisthiocarboxylic acid mononucleotide nickel chelatase
VTRVAVIDPVGGIAGDMLLAALLDAGAPRRVLDETVAAVAPRGVVVEVAEVDRASTRALHANVRVQARRRERPARDLRRVIDAASALPPSVRHRSAAILDRMIAAEARVHGVAPDDVVLHELGGDDTLVDICGTVALLDALRVDHVVCGPVPLASAQGATVASAHGRLSVPAPATLELLVGAPVVGVAAEGELVTPTGAAIVTGLADAWGAAPLMTLEAVGLGAGSRDVVDRPNVCRVLIGQLDETPTHADDVVQLEANVDDLLPELVPDVLAACMDAGALDAWAEPIHMKKGRPGLLLGVLACVRDRHLLAETMLRHATTLGVRVRPVDRVVADRAVREVSVGGHVVRVKLGMLHGEVINVAPEHDDCAAVTAATGRPVKQVWAEALAAAVAAPEKGEDAVAR